MEPEKDNELNYFAFRFCNGLGFWFGIEKYPKQNRKDFVIYFLFMQLAWVKQMVTKEEADDFLDKNSN